MLAYATACQTGAAGAAAEAGALAIDQPLPRAAKQLERVMIEAAEEIAGRLGDAAKLLGISCKGLCLKRKRWAIQREELDC